MVFMTTLEYKVNSTYNFVIPVYIENIGTNYRLNLFVQKRKKNSLPRANMKRNFVLIVFIIHYNYCINADSTSANRTLAPYNAIVGYASNNVEAYSNGNDSFISDEYSYLYGVFMGIKWQCVEYARRWLFQRKGCSFASVEGAADMWTQLDEVQRVEDKRCFPLRKYPNGSPSRPANESLLIYNRSATSMPYGHVAVIVDVLSDVIRVAEENWDFYYWMDNYPIIGWMSIIDVQNQTKPLDQMSIGNILKLNGSSPDFVYKHPS
ncbi:unnamed protein product [Adineta ricciae]|uniref:Peptidase C51 domain-containing protein n=1 Tax=Adineta ricciae TaxID=249248 RepID=A0A815MIT8_ADIRI|nr:unnamed protein product [Adineta ricciae]